MTHSTTYEDAVAAYEDFCERNGVIYQQPNRDLSCLVKSACPYWQLVNANGRLARVDAESLAIHGDHP